MANQESDTKAMELIKTSGVLNPNMTMDKLMELTQKLAAMEPPLAEAAIKPLHTDTFIHSHFIYKHED